MTGYGIFLTEREEISSGNLTAKEKVPKISAALQKKAVFDWPGFLQGSTIDLIPPAAWKRRQWISASGESRSEQFSQPEKS